MRPRLQVVVADAEPCPARPAVAPGDVLLVAFIFVLHAIPVVAVAAGRPWGSGLAGYATLVALVSGRETLHELGALLRSRGGHRRAARP